MLISINWANDGQNKKESCKKEKKQSNQSTDRSLAHARALYIN